MNINRNKSKHNNTHKHINNNNIAKCINKHKIKKERQQKK